MSQDPCPLCLIDTASGEGTLLAHAAQPALAARMAAVLQQAKIRHRQDGAFVSIEAGSSEWRRMIVALLRDTLSHVEQRLIRIGRADLGDIFGAKDLATYAEIVNTEWFDAALQRDRFSIFYQPIVNLNGGGAFAYECLIRLEADRVYNGAEIVAAATLRGDVLAFDNYAREKAIRSAAAEPQHGQKLFINFFPSAMYDPEACMESTISAIRNSALDPSDVVFEIIECDQLTDPDHTRRICDHFRRNGLRYAIDDLGAGTNSLEMIELLRPDYIKIDKSVIWNRTEPQAEELIQLSVALARRVGSEVIAEGVESARIATEVRRMGIHMMQGYFFGKPAPVMREETNAVLLEDLSRLSGAVTSSAAPDRQTALAPASVSRTPDTPA